VCFWLNFANISKPIVRLIAPPPCCAGILSLGGGNPNPKTFPIKSLQFSVEGIEKPIVFSQQDIDVALNYGGCVIGNSIASQGHNKFYVNLFSCVLLMCFHQTATMCELYRLYVILDYVHTGRPDWGRC
jgi:hypothetical protein